MIVASGVEQLSREELLALVVAQAQLIEQLKSGSRSWNGSWAGILVTLRHRRRGTA